MRRLMATAVGISLASAFGLAVAAEKPSFDELDKEGNGEVSVEKAVEAGVPEKEAKKEDLNGDGKLTKEDWRYIKMEPSEPQGEQPQGQEGEQGAP